MFKLNHDCFESFMKQCKLLINVVYPRAKHYCIWVGYPRSVNPRSVKYLECQQITQYRNNKNHYS